MKIALVTPYDYPYPGGVTDHLRSLDREFRRLGHTTRIIAPSSASETELEPNVIKVNGKVTPLRINGSVARITLSLTTLRHIKEIFSSETFEVVHIHEPEAPLLPLVTLLNSKMVTVGTFHSLWETNTLTAYAYPFFMLPVLERLDGRIFVSNPLREKVAGSYSGDTRVIPNGIDCKLYTSSDIRPFPEFNDDRPNLLYVGRMDKRKGFRHLLRAYRHIKPKFPEVRLLVVGAYQPEEVASFVSYARYHRLDDIHFIGKVSQHDLPRYYRSANIFCAPSTGSESFGIILLEAMAAGIPIVASDIVGYRSVLTHDHEGWLVKPGDEKAIAEAITNLLQDSQTRKRMTTRGRQTAQQYDWKVVAPRVLDYYYELLEARSDQKRSTQRKEFPLHRKTGRTIKIPVPLNFIQPGFGRKPYSGRQ